MSWHPHLLPRLTQWFQTLCLQGMLFILTFLFWSLWTLAFERLQILAGLGAFSNLHKQFMWNQVQTRASHLRANGSISLAYWSLMVNNRPQRQKSITIQKTPIQSKGSQSWSLSSSRDQTLHPKLRKLSKPICVICITTSPSTIHKQCLGALQSTESPW